MSWTALQLTLVAALKTQTSIRRPAEEWKSKLLTRVCRPHLCVETQLAWPRRSHRDRAHEDRSDECHRRRQNDGAIWPFRVRGSRGFCSSATAGGGIDRPQFGRRLLARTAHRPTSPAHWWRLVSREGQTRRASARRCSRPMQERASCQLREDRGPTHECR